MKVYKLTYSGRFTFEQLQNTIYKKSMSLLEGFSVDTLKTLCLNVCYLSLFTSGLELETGKSYSIFELVQNVPGMFSTSMFKFLSNLSNVGLNLNTKECLEAILQDSFSYELFDFLKCHNIVYVFLALSYEELYGSNTEWKNYLYSLLTRGTRLSTSEWETIYDFCTNGGC